MWFCIHTHILQIVLGSGAAFTAGRMKDTEETSLYFMQILFTFSLTKKKNVLVISACGIVVGYTLYTADLSVTQCNARVQWASILEYRGGGIRSLWIVSPKSLKCILKKKQKNTKKKLPAFA